MKSSLFKILVVTVTLAVIVPSVYLIVNQYKSFTSVQTPQSFVPADSQVAVKFNAFNESNYAFLENDSLAFILPMTTFSVTTGFNSSSALSNNSSAGSTGSFHYNYYETYDQVPIFNTSLNLSGFMAGTLTGTSYGPILNLTAGKLSLNNVSVYVASPISGIFVMGELNALHDAIDSNQRVNGAAPLNFSFNSSANISLYANLSFGNREYYLSGNLTSNNTLISLYGSSVNNSSIFYSAVEYSSAMFGGKVLVHDHSIVISVPLGVGSKLFSQLFKYFPSIISGAL